MPWKAPQAALYAKSDPCSIAMKKEMVAEVKGRPLTTPPTREPKCREMIMTIHKRRGMAASLRMTKDIGEVVLIVCFFIDCGIEKDIKSILTREDFATANLMILILRKASAEFS